MGSAVHSGYVYRASRECGCGMPAHERCERVSCAHNGQPKPKPSQTNRLPSDEGDGGELPIMCIRISRNLLSSYINNWPVGVSACHHVGGWHSPGAIHLLMRIGCCFRFHCRRCAERSHNVNSEHIVERKMRKRAAPAGQKPTPTDDKIELNSFGHCGDWGKRKKLKTSHYRKLLLFCLPMGSYTSLCLVAARENAKIRARGPSQRQNDANDNSHVNWRRQKTKIKIEYGTFRSQMSILHIK